MRILISQIDLWQPTSTCFRSIDIDQQHHYWSVLVSTDTALLIEASIPAKALCAFASTTISAGQEDVALDGVVCARLAYKKPSEHKSVIDSTAID